MLDPPLLHLQGAARSLEVGRGGASTPDQHARCMTTWSAPSATQHACTLLQHWVVRRWARVQLCVHLHQFHTNAPQPHPALVSPVHCHSALHSAPLAECRQQHTPPAHSPATRTAAHQTTHTPLHTRVQWTVLRLLLLTATDR